MLIQVNEVRLRSAGEASQRSTKEDWAEWMRHFSIELLKESPIPALRTCARLAQLQVLLVTFWLCTFLPYRCSSSLPPQPFLKKLRWFLPHEINLRIRKLMFCTLQPFVGRELFAAGFVSCWSQLNEASQRQLVRSLEMAFSSPNIPPEILATLLNLVSFCCFLR